MSESWKQRDRPVRLERRYQFDTYDELRDFLDRAAELSERDGLYPDLGFGRDYVNMTIYVEDGKTNLDDSQHRFAQQLDALLSVKAH